MKRFCYWLFIAIWMMVVLTLWANARHERYLMESANWVTGWSPPPPRFDDPATLNVFTIFSTFDMPVGYGPISSDMVRREKYQENMLPRYSPLDVRDVLDKIVTAPILGGEIVSLMRLIEPKEWDTAFRCIRSPNTRPVLLVIDGGRHLAPLLYREQVVTLFARYDDHSPVSTDGHAASTLGVTPGVTLTDVPAATARSTRAVVLAIDPAVFLDAGPLAARLAVGRVPRHSGDALPMTFLVSSALADAIDEAARRPGCRFFLAFGSSSKLTSAESSTR